MELEEGALIVCFELGSALRDGVVVCGDDSGWGLCYIFFQWLRDLVLLYLCFFALGVSLSFVLFFFDLLLVRSIRSCHRHFPVALAIGAAGKHLHLDVLQHKAHGSSTLFTGSRLHGSPA